MLMDEYLSTLACYRTCSPLWRGDLPKLRHSNELGFPRPVLACVKVVVVADMLEKS